MTTLAQTIRPSRYPALLPILSIVAFALVVAAVLRSAGWTLGYDFLAYHAAAARILAGQPVYDTSVQVSGGFGLFYYPPPFAIALLPFGALDATLATWLWIALLVAGFALGVALMPVSANVRWAIVLLGAVSWPLVYAFKLGQVGPLLFLAFAAGWRWLQRPAVVGSVAAVGTLVKLQPGLLFVWAALVARWRVILAGVVVLAAAAALATIVVGFAAWTDYVTLLRQVSQPITTPHNFTFGAVAYQAGASVEAATAIQVVTSAIVVVLVLVAARWVTPPASYLVTIVASQLLSPVLWDHYALLLLLPVAYLLSRGYRWSALIPLATSVTTIFVVPPATYPIAFAVTLVAVMWAGRRAQPDTGRAA